MRSLLPVVFVLAFHFAIFTRPSLCQDAIRVDDGFTNVGQKGPLRFATPQGKMMFLEASLIERRNAPGIFMSDEEAKKKGKIRTGLSSPGQLQFQTYPSLFRLKGDVVIRMNCFIPPEGRLPACVVLRADEAQYDEETGEVKATGTVRVRIEPTLLEQISAERN